MEQEHLRPTDGNVIVVVDGDKIPELEVTGSTRSFTCDTFHSAAITEEKVCVVGKEIKARLVEFSGALGLCDSQTDGIRETLTEWTSGDFYTGCVVSFGVTRCDAVDLLRSVSASVLNLYQG